MSGPRMSPQRVPPWFGALALGLAIPLCLGTLSARADVLRCEDAKGKITYSNTACPEGTARERPVAAHSAVEVPDSGASSTADRVGVKRSGGAGTTSGAPPSSRDDAHAQLAYCDDLVRRIGFRQQDLLSTTGNERASAELALRRLQDEHQGNCEHH